MKWLRVRLTGKAQTALIKLPDASRQNYGEYLKALKERFLPESRKEFYVAELNAWVKRVDEDWATFGDALRVKAYSDLEEKAREHLALNQFLTQIDNPQVAFGVRQKRPQNIEEAVATTNELELYLFTCTSSCAFPTGVFVDHWARFLSDCLNVGESGKVESILHTTFKECPFPECHLLPTSLSRAPPSPLLRTFLP